MPNLADEYRSPEGDNAWEGPHPKWVRVDGRDDVGKVVSYGGSIGSGINLVSCAVVLFESGEICLYKPGSGILTRCDEDGNTQKP